MVAVDVGAAISPSANDLTTDISVGPSGNYFGYIIYKFVVTCDCKALGFECSNGETITNNNCLLNCRKFLKM